MLFLLFQLGDDRYALEASRVVEVVPLLALKQIPQTAPGFAGIFSYRGRPVPAIDLCQLTLGVPARERLSTRIIIVSCPDRQDSGSPSPWPSPPGEGIHGRGNSGARLVGLIAEQVTEMIRKDASEFSESGFNVRGAPYLGPVLFDQRGTIQWIHEQKLLTDNVREIVFSEAMQLTA